MFLLSQNDENQSENGSKNSKIRLRARPPAEPQKKKLQTKKLRSKSWKHGVFSLFACRFWTGAFTNRCLPYCFLQCFLKASVTTYQKQEVLAEKCPPPGKPVTFYECHPEDHAPAPSVRADFFFSFHFDVHPDHGKRWQSERKHLVWSKNDIGLDSTIFI